MFRLKSSRDSGFSSKIGTIPSSSGRLDTLQGFFGEVRGHTPPKKLKFKIFKLLELNALKLSILPLPRYFCIILNLLRSHQADLFGSWGGGGGGLCAHPAHPIPAYGPG